MTRLRLHKSWKTPVSNPVYSAGLIVGRDFPDGTKLRLFNEGDRYSFVIRYPAGLRSSATGFATKAAASRVAIQRILQHQPHLRNLP